MAELNSRLKLKYEFYVNVDNMTPQEIIELYNPDTMMILGAINIKNIPVENKSVSGTDCENNKNVSIPNSDSADNIVHSNANIMEDIYDEIEDNEETNILSAHEWEAQQWQQPSTRDLNVPI